MNKTEQSTGVVTITQVKSAIGRKPGQKETLVGLGLNKLYKTRTLKIRPLFVGWSIKSATFCK